MHNVLFYIGIVCAVFAGIFLIATVSMFVGFKIPSLIKDSSGELEQKQIEEIRNKNNAAMQQRNKVNVFEELEKKAKLRKGNTQSLNLGPTTAPRKSAPQGTTVLQRNENRANTNFVLEKNIVFVSTNEMI